MLSHSPKQKLNPVLLMGLGAFVLANFARYVIERAMSVPEHIADPLNGFLMGASIGLMLVGVARQAHLKHARKR